MQQLSFESWIQGSPQRMRDPQTNGFIDRMHKAFPVSRQHREVLQRMGSDFTYARRMEDGSWEALIAFNSGIASRLGITGNVAVLYVPYRDLYDNILQRVLHVTFPRQTEEHLRLLCSADNRELEKLTDWTMRSPVRVVSMPRNGSTLNQAETLFSSLLRSISGRNAYEVSNAVTGDDFFGRQQVIHNLTRDLQEGYVSGVFGLRKVGKTSLVKEVMSRFDAVSHGGLKVVTVIEDLENLPDELSSKVPRLCGSLATTLQGEFKRAGMRTHELSRLTGALERGGSIGPIALRDAIQASLSHSSGQDAVVVLALDEVESLVAGGDSSESAPQVVEFLGSLRSLSQELDSFKVMLAGITAAPFRQGMIYGRENPLFSWAKPVYLGPLAPDEAKTMTVRLGRRMAVNWTPEALDELQGVTSGHAFLHRSFAGHVVQAQLDEGLDGGSQAGHSIRANDVKGRVRAWKREASEIVDAMVGALQRYYPAGWGVVEDLREGYSLSDIEEDDPGAVAMLLNLGVLQEVAGDLGVSPWARISTTLRSVG